MRIIKGKAFEQVVSDHLDVLGIPYEDDRVNFYAKIKCQGWDTMPERRQQLLVLSCILMLLDNARTGDWPKAIRDDGYHLLQFNPDVRGGRRIRAKWFDYKPSGNFVSFEMTEETMQRIWDFLYERGYIDDDVCVFSRHIGNPMDRYYMVYVQFAPHIPVSEAVLLKLFI